MNKKLKVSVLCLTVFLLLSSFAYAGDISVSDTELTTPLDSFIDIKESEYVVYSGEIKEIINRKDGISILVKSGSEYDNYDRMIFNIHDDIILLSNKSKDFVDKVSLEEGMSVSVFYRKDTPMTKSLPPMLNPLAIVIEDANEHEYTAVRISRFNEHLISSDNYVKLHLTEKTVITNKEGEAISIEEVYGKETIAFYGPIMTLSIPGQTSVHKMIVIEDEIATEGNQILATDKIVIKDIEYVLKNQMYVSEDIQMIPLREITEILGYEVNWNQKDFIAELSRDNQWITVKPNEDNYSFARMFIMLGKSSELIDGVTYVPLDFVERVLQLNLNVLDDGTLSIM